MQVCSWKKKKSRGCCVKMQIPVRDGGQAQAANISWASCTEIHTVNSVVNIAVSKVHSEK